MQVDARTLANGTEIEADVCIVGSGPAGITLARELGDLSLRVCVLESGGIRIDRAAQSLSKGENADDAYYRLDQVRVRGLGGTSLHWPGPLGWRTRPLDELDFEERPEVGRPGWPFGKKELEPHYTRAAEIAGLGQLDGELGTWADDDAAAPLALNPHRVQTVLYRLAPLNVFERHIAALRRASTTTVYLHATALELVPDDTGASIERAVVAVGRDRRLSVRAKRFVLAGGGIENARLLLLSNRRHPAGLGNAQDLVGRFFMEHPHLWTGIVKPEDATLMQRVGLYGHRQRDEAVSEGMLQLTPEVLRREELLSSVWIFIPVNERIASPAGKALLDLRALGRLRRVVPHTGKRLRTVLSDPMAVAASAKAAVDRRTGVRSGAGWTVLQLAVMSEQEPNPLSRVTLGRRRDIYGQPVARLDWRLTDLDRRSIRRSQDILDEEFRNAGIGQIEDKLGDEDPPARLSIGYHHLGTTRMHDDPKQGVVDPDGRVHGIGNLYMTGGSVFTAGGCANPTLTVMALALRLAAHLKDEAKTAGLG